MAFSKVTLFGETLMDTTQDTVTSPTLFQNETATGADGEQVTGAYVPPTVVTDSASGNMVTFERITDGMPVNSLAVSIGPLQNGEGDSAPDNARAFRGWTGARITRIKKNPCPPFTIGYYYDLDTGVIQTGSTSAITPIIRADFSLGAVTLSFDVSLRSMAYAWDNDGNFIGRTTGGPANPRTISPSDFSNGSGGTKEYSKITFIAIRMYEGTESTDDISAVSTAHIQLDPGTAPTAYEPHQGEIKHISWQSDAGVIYKGILDATEGLLTVTHGLVDMGDLPWQYDSNGYFYISGMSGKAYGATNLLCSIYKTEYATAANMQNYTICGRDSNANVFVKDSRFADADAYKVAVTGQAILYELAVPLSYQLSPTEIMTAFGENNLWADLIDENNALSNTGEVAVTFGADIKKYVDESVGNIPKDYYKAEIEQTIQDVQAANTEPGLVFLLCTDIHYLSKNGDFPGTLVKKDSVTDMCVNMKSVLKEIKADGLVCLGDLVDGGWISEYTTAETISQIRYVMSQLHGVGLPLLYALGNHDDNRYITGEYFTPEELYARNMSFCPTERVSDVVMNGLNYYMDYPSQKIRCISVDSSYFNGENWVYGWDDNTLDWFTDQLAAIPEGWGVIVFSHLGFVQDNNVGKTLYYNQQNMIDAIDAFIDGGGNYIATIYGHSHVDYSNSTPWLEITLGCAKPLNGTIGSTHPSGSTKPTRTRGTATEDLWDILIIQPNSRTIKAVRFGAGLNSTWTY